MAGFAPPGFPVPGAVSVPIKLDHPLAHEGGMLHFVAGALIAYGAAGHNDWSFHVVPPSGQLPINNATLGDPLFGVGKHAYFASGGLAVEMGRELAGENQRLHYPPGAIVAYGRAGYNNWSYRTMPASGHIHVDNTHFGDPLPGVPKAAYPATWVSLDRTISPAAHVGNEGQTISRPPGTIIAYGQLGQEQWSFRVVPATGVLTLDNATFGDPLFGAAKAGYVVGGHFNIKLDHELAHENGVVHYPPGTIIAYGNKGHPTFAFRTVPSSGMLPVNNATFGDPAFGVPKAAYLAALVA